MAETCSNLMPDAASMSLDVEHSFNTSTDFQSLLWLVIYPAFILQGCPLLEFQTLQKNCGM